MKSYDYIIAGAGCAGLSLAVHLIESGKFEARQILIIDRQQVRTNDRTWCFWEAGTGMFEPVVSKKWKHLNFYQADFSALLDISPYAYKLIRGDDFYRYAIELISRQPNFDWFYGDIEAITDRAAEVVISSGAESFTAGYVFSSIRPARPADPKVLTLQQHFKGLLIETDEPVFNAGQATLMDFTIPQPGEAAFMYMLPLSSRRALVEYTLFGKNVWAPESYDSQLQSYLQQIPGLKDYRIIETELGSIPMTTWAPAPQAGRIVQLGISGGQTKASTGYTFKFIQQHAAALVAALGVTGEPLLKTSFFRRRFQFYDNVLLRVLHAHPDKGAYIFGQLFKANNILSVLRFLDNESTLAEELKLTLSLPKGLFIPSAMRELFKVPRY